MTRGHKTKSPVAWCWKHGVGAAPGRKRGGGCHTEATGRAWRERGPTCLVTTEERRLSPLGAVVCPGVVSQDPEATRCKNGALGGDAQPTVGSASPELTREGSQRSGLRGSPQVPQEAWECVRLRGERHSRGVGNERTGAGPEPGSRPPRSPWPLLASGARSQASAHCHVVFLKELRLQLELGEQRWERRLHQHPHFVP